ncbi:hypothetical protein [Subtercola boreus]|uniref:hypothetical protein n=1 Tax=Subtercola boreus TaxID=120213 RepID=UPI0015586B83|nr:hypothetical protein [Subtercola boreus]
MPEPIRLLEKSDPNGPSSRALEDGPPAGRLWIVVADDEGNLYRMPSRTGPRPNLHIEWSDDPETRGNIKRIADEDLPITL